MKSVKVISKRDPYCFNQSIPTKLEITLDITSLTNRYVILREEGKDIDNKDSSVETLVT